MKASHCASGLFVLYWQHVSWPWLVKLIKEQEANPSTRFSRHDFKKTCLLAALLTVLLFSEKRKRMSWVHLCLRGEWIDHLSLLEINGGEMSLKPPSTIGHHPRWVYTHTGLRQILLQYATMVMVNWQSQKYYLSLHVSSYYCIDYIVLWYTVIVSSSLNTWFCPILLKCMCYLWQDITVPTKCSYTKHNSIIGHS